MVPDPASRSDEASELKLGSEFRMTRQRRVVFDVLMDERDHPTASEVFLRTKDRMPNISLATVYNCLETLTRSGLVRQVNTDRGPARYCPNQQEHAHFCCEECGAVTDVEPSREPAVAESWLLPEGGLVRSLEVVIRGLCPKCASSRS